MHILSEPLNPDSRALHGLGGAGVLVGLSPRQQLLSLSDGGFAQLAIHQSGAVQQVLELLERVTSCLECLAFAAILFVTEVFGKGCACLGEVEPPSLESCGVVGESSEVLA